jgi:hypothetical protein
MTVTQQKLAFISQYKVSVDGLNWFAIHKDTGYIISGLGCVIDALKSLDNIATLVLRK